MFTIHNICDVFGKVEYIISPALAQWLSVKSQCRPLSLTYVPATSHTLFPISHNACIIPPALAAAVPDLCLCTKLPFVSHFTRRVSFPQRWLPVVARYNVSLPGECAVHPARLRYGRIPRRRHAGRWRCPLCGRQFSREVLLDYHHRAEHATAPYAQVGGGNLQQRRG